MVSLLPGNVNQGLVASGLGDKPRAQAAFLTARERVASAVREQPDDGKPLMVLAQIDAVLGRKEDALREGQRAIELIPITKDALIGNLLLNQLAGLYAQAGEADHAFNLLEKMAKIPFGVSYGRSSLIQSGTRSAAIRASKKSSPRSRRKNRTNKAAENPAPTLYPLVPRRLSPSRSRTH